MSVFKLPKNASNPNFDLFNFAHDFVLNGVPMSFIRTPTGALLPSVGAEVNTPYGRGYIERKGTAGYIIRVVEFNNSTLPRFSRTSNEIIGEVSSSEHVASLAGNYNRYLEQQAGELLQKFGDTKATMEKVDALLSLALDDECYEARMGGDFMGCVEFAYRPASEPSLRNKKKSRAELKAERTALEAAADEFIDSMPESIVEELAEVFGV